jgi:2-methylcitrate dehydratase PrpD
MPSSNGSAEALESGLLKRAQPSTFERVASVQHNREVDFATRVGDWLSEVAVPERTLALTRRAIVDTLAVSIAAYKDGLGQAASQYVSMETGATGTSLLWGEWSLVPERAAAWVNGIRAHALDFDDVAYPFYGHPSAVLVPALLASGSSIGASMDEVADAHATALQVANSLGHLNPAHYSHGFHATGTLGTVAAAAGVARLLGLDGHRSANAVAIAASLGSGLRSNVGTETKWLHVGNAASQGIVAARMAEAGWTGRHDAYESPVGFASAHGTPGVEMGPCREALTGPWWDSTLGAYGVKLYPSCACTHPGVDAARAIRRRLQDRASEVVEVRAWMQPLAREILFCHSPSSPTEARFSLPFTVSVALAQGDLGLESFTYERIRSPDVQRLVDGFKVDTLPDWDRYPEDAWSTRIEVVLSDGTTIGEVVSLARGP